LTDIDMIPIWVYDYEEKKKKIWTLNQVIDYLNDLCGDQCCFSIHEENINNVIVDESQ